MRQHLEKIEHHTCPQDVAKQLLAAGGTNRYGEPMFRCVWGFDRIVKMHGTWQKIGQYKATLKDKLTGYQESRIVTKLESEVTETREVPKYLPGNCWHLEMWRPPEEYGSPEDWKKAGEEISKFMTVDTSGPYPERGEYELCYPITHDLTSRGKPLPLDAELVYELIRQILHGREHFTYMQRRAAIEQRIRREDDGFVRRAMDILKDGKPAFSGEEFVTVTETKKEIAP